MRIHRIQPGQDGNGAGSESRNLVEGSGAAFEKLFTVEELAVLWSLSIDTIRRLFEREPGILMLALRKPGRRRYRTLRIPLSVAERVYRRLTLS